MRDKEVHVLLDLWRDNFTLKSALLIFCVFAAIVPAFKLLGTIVPNAPTPDLSLGWILTLFIIFCLSQSTTGYTGWRKLVARFVPSLYWTALFVGGAEVGFLISRLLGL